MRRLIPLLVLLFALPVSARPAPTPPVESLSQLAAAIDGVRERRGAPGVAVALLKPGGEVWQHTAGMADIDVQRSVTVDTRFRIASISKMFVSLAVLRLQEQGRLSLDDRVAALAPEIEFDNPWESNHPLRLVHLLNHSSGWDAPHFAEQIGSDGRPLSIREALALHPHSRRSRWAPGSRTAYNNTGPLVAAYIVEKVSGADSYEDYVREQFFEPLGMEASGYYYSDDYRSNAAGQYHGGRELPYWHLNNRAAGGMHSSLNDMQRFARMLLDRGRIGGTRLLSAESIRRGETPTQTLAAKAGLQVSQGLGNNSFHRNGVVFRGHEGGLPGASALLAYQPQMGIAHIVLANGSGPVAAEIHRLLADFVTRNHTVEPVAAERKITGGDRSLSGHYRVANPAMQSAEFLADLVPWTVNVRGDSATIGPLLGMPPRKLVPAAGGGFLQESTGRVALVRVRDPAAGELLHYGPQALEKVGAVGAYGPPLLAVSWFVCAVVGLGFLPIWLPRYWLGKIRPGGAIAMRAWPLLTLSGLLAALLGVKMAMASPVPYALAGRLSLPTLLVFAGSIAFFVCALWSLWVWFRYRSSRMNRFVKYHSTVLILLNLLVGLYLLSYGVIGIRLWA
ncbi:serine hydrolase domain-containing protein [Microbulbifer halophilus]|uniref:Serine hydrolase domain-containing protein n=1 Tax=Microbulbifer halophilus TaxID=453963 RepID=A0ABW5EDY9_9GAMM|nr:serine hydrolase domain-containing protein [Microbulbifer halophilus]MCW8126663.1 serine hydrolase [Microbulbifer halophilus]